MVTKGFAFLSVWNFRLNADLNAHTYALADLALRGAALRLERTGGAPLLLGRLHATGLHANLDAAVFSAGAVTLAEGSLRVERLADGAIALPGLKLPTPPSHPGERQPQWKVGNLALENFDVDFADAQAKASLKLKVENLRADGAESSLTRPIGLSVRLGVNNVPAGPKDVVKAASTAASGAVSPASSSKGAQVEFAGEVTPKPAAVKGRLRVADAALTDFTPWAPPLPLNVARGRLRVAGELSYAEGAPIAARFTGNVGLEDFAALDPTLASESLACAGITLTGLDFNLSPMTANVGVVALDRGALTVRLTKEHGLRIAGMDIPLGQSAPAKTSGEPPKPKTPKTAARTAKGSAADSEAPPLNFSIERIEASGTQLVFQDAGFTQPYEARVSEIKAAVSGLAQNKPSHVELSAKVNQTGRIKAAGTIWPFAKQMKFEMKASAEGLDLTDASPYSKKYTGFPIVRGKFGCALDYRIDRKSIDLKNELLLSKVEIGKKAAVPGAMDVPLDLGVSLLQDGEGNIVLFIPIKDESGQFNVGVGPIIGKAFSGFFAKILFAPFSFLNVAGGAGNSSFLAFAPGSAELSPAAKAQLTELAKGVAERPRLSLELVGQIDRNADAPTLKLQSLRKRLPALVGESGEGGQLTEAEHLRLLRKAYAAAYGKVQAASTELMEKALSAKAPVTDEEWRAFARQRALAARAFLMEVGKLPDGRIFIAERDPDPANPALTSRVDVNLKY